MKKGRAYWESKGFVLQKTFPGEYDILRHPRTLQTVRLYFDGPDWIRDLETGEYRAVREDD
jgi:hypothetical protein